MHDILEFYDRTAAKEQDREQIMRTVVRYALEVTTIRTEDAVHFFETSDSKRSRYNLVRAIIWYIDKFHGEDMQTATLPDGKAALELSFRIVLPFEHDGTPFLYCGHIDKIGDIGSQLFIVERKHTTTTLSGYYFDRFAPNNQISGYKFAADVMMGHGISGVIVDAVQVAEGFSRYIRAPVHRNQEQTQEWLENLGEWLAMAKHYAERNVWPMNEEACHLYGGCTYRPICRMAKGARQKFLESNFVRQGWDPLRSRGSDE
jgi:hypothetical protein